MADRRAPVNLKSVRTVAEMVGEGLREAAILIAVFGWLEKVVRGEPLRGYRPLVIAGFGFVLFAAGIAIELVRAGSAGEE